MFLSPVCVCVYNLKNTLRFVCYFSVCVCVVKTPVQICSFPPSQANWNLKEETENHFPVLVCVCVCGFYIWKHKQNTKKNGRKRIKKNPNNICDGENAGHV